MVVTHSFDTLSLPWHLLTTGLPSSPLTVSLCSAVPSIPSFLVLPFQEGFGSVSLTSMDGSLFFFLPSHLGRISCRTTPSPPPSTQILCLHWSKCCPFSTAITTQFAFAVSLYCYSQLLPQNILWILFANREHLKSHWLLLNWFGHRLHRLQQSRFQQLPADRQEVSVHWAGQRMALWPLAPELSKSLLFTTQRIDLSLHGRITLACVSGKK